MISSIIQENHIDASVNDIRPQYWENEHCKLFAFEFVSNLKFSLDIHRHFDYSMIKEENIYIYLHRNKNTKKSNHCFIFYKSENVKYMFCTNESKKNIQIYQHCKMKDGLQIFYSKLICMQNSQRTMTRRKIINGCVKKYFCGSIELCFKS